MTNIYILKLEENKYYIGKTNYPNYRITDHYNSEGSAWTSKYKPVSVVKIIADCDQYDEDKYTLKYMNKYGIDSVRGGTFTSISLGTSRQQIEKMLKSSNDECFKCGSHEHFARECDTQDDWNVINAKPHKLHVSNNETICYVCKRKSHTAEHCYAKKDIYNNPITFWAVCYRCGADDHWRITCDTDVDVFGRPTETTVFDKLFASVRKWFQ